MEHLSHFPSYSTCNFLLKNERQYIRQVCIYEQEQCQGEKYPHGYAVCHGAEDLLSGELSYYRHELKLLASYDEHYKAGDLEAREDNDPEEDNKHEGQNRLDHHVVIDIWIYRSAAHVHAHPL